MGNERPHALLSASSASRWIQCTRSAVAATLYPPQDTAFTREGTLAHKVAEYLARGAGTPVEPGIDDDMVRHGQAYADYIKEQVRSDQATVLLEQRVSFDRWVPDGFGTADCIILQGEEMDVIDYKYGKGVQVSAKENPQMMLYGLGAMNEYGFVYDVKRVRLHIFQPRIGNISVWETSVADLMNFAEEVAPIAADAAKGEGYYAAGYWCQFCPHAGRCPELANHCMDFVKIAPDLVTTVDRLSPALVAQILKEEPVITLWLNKVREQALADMLDGGEIPGWKVVAGRSTRAWSDELEVADILQKAGYGMDEITKTELLSPAALEKAVGKKRVTELLSGHIMTNSGKPTVAAADDKRPAYNRAEETKKDFMED